MKWPWQAQFFQVSIKIIILIESWGVVVYATNPFLCLDEYETLCECSEKLRIAVQSTLTSLSGHLLEKHLITPEHDCELRNGCISEPERAAKLVELVRYKVELDHENYYTFVSILEADSGYYNEILKLVKSKLEEKKTARRGTVQVLQGSLLLGSIDVATFFLLAGSLTRKPLNEDVHVQKPSDDLCCRKPTLERSGVSLDSSFICPCHKCSFENYITEGCPTAGPGLYPYLDKSKLSESAMEDLIHELSSQTQDILRHFADLRTNTRKSLTTRNVEPDEVADSALSLMKQFDPCYIKELNEASEKSVARVFMVLSRHMSFFNYEILEHIIQHLGTDDDRRNLARYLEHFRNFCRRSVFQVPSGVLGSSPAAGEVKLSVYITDLKIYGDGASDITLVSIKRIQWKLASILHVKASTLQVYEIEIGSIIILLTVPSTMAVNLLRYTREQGLELQSCGLQLSISDTTDSENQVIDNSTSVQATHA